MDDCETHRKEGLTGEKAAMLLWKDSWGEIGVPAIITTDQDPRFVSSFFTTICALSGCRVVFSQAHRPQANGRAESAGKVIRDIMRKLFLEEARSWVLLLPLAIRIRHDTIDPELGISSLSSGHSSPLRSLLPATKGWDNGRRINYAQSLDIPGWRAK